MSLHIKVSDNAAQVLASLAGFDERMTAALTAALDDQNQDTITAAQLTKLTGPRPHRLGGVTNRLRSSLTAAKARPVDRMILSAIGSNVRYAGVHEYGFDGNVTVRAFTRRDQRSDVFAAPSVFNPKTGRIKKGRTKKVADGFVTVRAHSRHLRVPERSYIRSTLAERAEAYGEALSEAVLLAWKGGRA